MRSPLLRTAPAALFLSMAASCGVASEPEQPGAPAQAVCADPLNDDDGHCALQLKDSLQRTGAPAIGQDETLDEAAVAMHRFARDAGCLEPELGSDGHCAGTSELAATEAYVTKVRRSLTAGGYSGATVRLARDSDPTAPGALIYAVRIGDVCVLGDVTPPPAERWHEWYAGLLPDGTCLTP
ncbi:hypothetical protein [Actinoplanes sp. GCM10030250]|uniref:hypothetical protein n=1 Tax=Actinoplanes sp. GCM10030250 TaxID=3273376 RepID=UPI0036138A47